MAITKKVWVNGTFDVVHRGHIELFKFAKSQGDYLTVGIDTDRRITENKGEGRPINTQLDRKYFLEAIKYIDEVRIFDSDLELVNMIAVYHPQCMVIGSDWMGKEVIGSEYTRELIYFNRVGDYSTSNILSK
tara:strand:+ start:1378 stop:1773 length:396 start_codon:yes stop_codon:yes gene_type:complete